MSRFVKEINDSPLAAERAEKDILGNKIDEYYSKLSLIAPQYSPESTYVFDQLVFQEDTLYKCSVNCGPEEWNQYHWTEVNDLSDYIKNLQHINLIPYGSGKYSQVSSKKVNFATRGSGGRTYYAPMLQSGYGVYYFTYIDGRSLVTMSLSPDGGDGTWAVSSISIPQDYSSVIPSDASSSNNLVTTNTLDTRLADFDTALQGKQDDLGISSSGDAGKFLNEQGSWQVPVYSRSDGHSVWYRNSSWTCRQLLNQHVGKSTTWDNTDDYDLTTLKAGDTIKIYITVTNMANAHFVMDLKVTAVSSVAPAATVMAIYQADQNEVLDGTDADANNFVIPGNYILQKVTQVSKNWPGAASGSLDYTNLCVTRIVRNDASSPYSDSNNIQQSVRWSSRQLYRTKVNGAWGSWRTMPMCSGNYNTATGSATKPVYVNAKGAIVECTGWLNRACCLTSSPTGLTKDDLSNYDTFVLPSGSNPILNVSDLVVDRPYKFFINGESNSNLSFKISFSVGTLSSYVVYNKGSSSTKTGTYGYSESIKSQPLIVVRSISGSTNQLFIVGY